MSLEKWNWTGLLTYQKGNIMFTSQGKNPAIEKLNMGSLKGSVLRPILFLLNKNDLSNVIVFRWIYHFADDTSYV